MGVEPFLSWVWLKIKELGLRRFWSMFPLPRATHFGTCFLSYSQLFKANRPFDLLAFPFWSIFSHGPKRLTF